MKEGGENEDRDEGASKEGRNKRKKERMKDGQKWGGRRKWGKKGWRKKKEGSKKKERKKDEGNMKKERLPQEGLFLKSYIFETKKIVGICWLWICKDLESPRIPRKSCRSKRKINRKCQHWIVLFSIYLSPHEGIA